jgi:DNA-binding helix-hairpin-helix protein with protein kinase domain
MTRPWSSSAVVRIPPTLSTKTGRLIRPGEEIARGGEGVIFALLSTPGEVLKVYKDSRELAEKRRKVECMTKMYRPGLASHTAWPTDFVDGQLLAILMPRVSGIELHDVYGPKSRMTKFPTARNKFLVTVAFNLCAALEDIHATGAVVGDFNQRNILVGIKADVCFIDCDSFQIRVGATTYWCPVGIPDFLAPEVQGVSLATLVRTPNHDNFTLAVLIFQILFLGKHPFAGGDKTLPLRLRWRGCRPRDSATSWGTPNGLDSETHGSVVRASILTHRCCRRASNALRVGQRDTSPA